MARSVSTFLMFTGDAEQAMNFYVTLFKDSQIKKIEKYGPEEAGREGSIKRADFTIADRDFMAIDSPAAHDFTFTPSMSLFVECEDEAELDGAFRELSVDGQVMMPPDNYGFSDKFAWVADRFGVSWQLNLNSTPVSS